MLYIAVVFVYVLVDMLVEPPFHCLVFLISDYLQPDIPYIKSPDAEAGDRICTDQENR